MPLWKRTGRNLFWPALIGGSSLLCSIALLTLAAAAGEPGSASSGSLPPGRGVGQRVANFTLKDAVTGRDVVLYGYAGAKAAVLVFLSTDCPVVKLYAPRLAELAREYRSKGVVFLGLYPNAHETEAQIAEHARESGIDFPVMKDRENRVADLTLVERTPEVLVLDGRGQLRYRGAVDDQYGQGTRKAEATRHYLKEAIDALVARKPVTTASTAVAGCLLDRVEPATKKAPARPRIRPAPESVISAWKEEEKRSIGDAQKVSFAGEAARIIQEKCQGCHRPGQVAPFSLLTYDDARKHAAMIQEVVDNRRMPPWHADPRYGQFANDRSLSAKERATLMAWVEQGAPLGDPKQVPPTRNFPEGWTIGKPDLTFEIPETYIVPAQGVVEYVHFRVPTKFTEDKWIQAAEAQPSDRSVVHHIIVYVDDKSGKKGRRGEPRLAHLSGYAPGDMPSIYPPGTAKRIPAGSDLVFQVHYTPVGRILKDRSKVGLIFAKTPVTRQAYTVGIAQEDFIIPPGESNAPVASSLTLGQDIRLLSFMPHMHLRGKDFEYKITRPGKPTEVALSVPAYDFGWQSYYVLKDPLLLPKGTRIDCLAHFDNSDKNLANPDPTKTVRWGDQTFEEMMIGYIDIDLPVGTSLERLRDPDVARTATAGSALKVLGALLGGTRNAQPRTDRQNPSR